MTNQVKIYKILGEKPSIYVEIIDTHNTVDLELYLDSKLEEVACSKVSNYVFEVTKPGVYSVVAKYNETLQLNSNSLSFLVESFQPNSLLKPLREIRPIKLYLDEPEIDGINKFHVEIKVKKSREKSIAKALVDTVGLDFFQKKSLNLSSFRASHSIHSYEYYKTFSELSKEDAKYICRNIKGIEGVVYCSMVPVTDKLLPPKSNRLEQYKNNLDRASDTPDFSELQGYLDEPYGMNVRNAWSNCYSGELVAIRHLDFGIYKNHENLQSGNITVINSRDETEDCNHGTASTGCIAAGNNGFGVTGIAHSSSFYFYDTEDKDKILENANPGDIVSLNVQFLTNGVYIPPIGIKSWWDTIHNITEKGAVVIVSAGNSGVDLSDTSICPDFGDSGAIIVGACSSSTGRKLSFSNFGHYSSLINSWGENVTTTGYGTLQDLPGHDRDYTNTFNGTSSATPLCSGALALLQCYAKKQAVILTTENIKQLLNESNYIEGVNDLIGKRPNVKQLFTCIDKLILSTINQD